MDDTDCQRSTAGHRPQFHNYKGGIGIRVEINYIYILTNFLDNILYRLIKQKNKKI